MGCENPGFPIKEKEKRRGLYGFQQRQSFTFDTFLISKLPLILTVAVKTDRQSKAMAFRNLNDFESFLYVHLFANFIKIIGSSFFPL